MPKPQRRGAIIILGMLALAKRSVVTDRVDTLLRIGLGPFGKVGGVFSFPSICSSHRRHFQADLTLARYTCVALQRLNGSAKKVKGMFVLQLAQYLFTICVGSLLDKTLRLDMDNAIFRKLQEAVEYPCRLKDWFGMAEQAINTVYALGEHPDVFCNDLIKNLTIRAFNRRPKTAVSEDKENMNPNGMDEDGSVNTPARDTFEETASEDEEKDIGDAFQLSQLLFVVGHVAIKHIVFLELVEREWKRQKDEKSSGEDFDTFSYEYLDLGRV